MYNLTPRWKNKSTSTPDNLGPNNYFLECGCTLKNRAPFLSTTPRKSISRVAYTEAIYNAALPVSIKGGTSLRYTSGRSTVTHWTTPGPGEYNPKLPKKKTRATPTKEEVKGKHLYVCRVPYSLEAKGPTIPTKIDENGYYIGPDGFLKKCPPNVYDTSLGPAYYNVETKLGTTEKLYRGCHWSKSQSKRWVSVISDTPSPADYTIDKKPYVDPYIAHMQEMARLYCPQPRFCDLLVKKIINEDLPAANQYYIEPNTKQNSLSLVTVGFSSSKSRFLHKADNNPSPAQFDLRTGLSKKSVSTKQCGFNVQSKRLKENKPQNMPGPADYEITNKSIKGELIKQLKKMTPSYPAFNSMGRQPDSSEKESVLKPSPNQYVIQAMRQEPQKCGGSVFRSTTFQRPQLKVPKTAEPATYNITSAFNKNKEQKSFNVMDISFQTTFPRTGTFKVKEGPGPAVYSEHKKVNNKGFFLPTTPRFRDLQETPGPGEHHIHPQFAFNTTWKATFTHNLRLKENAFHMKLRQPSTKTKDTWEKETRKQRKLYAFYKDKPKRIASWIELDQ